MLRWRENIFAFTQEALGVSVWSGPTGHQGQADILRAFQDGSWTAVSSGHKTGKSRAVAICGLWWCCTQEGAPRFVPTAPTNRQLREVIWKEVRTLYAKATVPLGGRCYETVTGGIRWPSGAELFGVSAKNTEAFAGLSGAKMAIAVDEASGYDERIFEAVMGNLAGGGKLLLTGNPTQNSGTFFEVFNRRLEAWQRIIVSSLNTPNFHGGRVPGLADPTFAKLAAEMWGENSNRWRVRLEGLFATDTTDTVISLGALEKALLRWAIANDCKIDGSGAVDPFSRESAPLILGVDVARFGDDDSVIATRRGPLLRIADVVHGQDTDAITHRTRRVAGLMRRAEEEPPLANVDVIGVGGGVVDQAVKFPRELRVQGISVGSKATQHAPGGLEYCNFRTELWFRMAEFLRAQGALCPDPRLEAELLAPRYGYDESGRYKVEPKDETKKRIGRSPDRADAALLTLVEPVRRTGGQSSGRSSRGAR